MSVNADTLRKRMETAVHLRRFLFIRGFLVTDNTEVDALSFPFYGTWKHTEREGFHFYTHPLTGVHFVDIPSGGVIYLLGHAYNPFTMEHEEIKILTRLAEYVGQQNFFDYVSELTGIFVLGLIRNGLHETLVDPAGIQSACHGVVAAHYYLSSHPQLVADVCGLKMDSFVKRLICYKWYPRVMGPYLPADLTPFAELKRIVPNNVYCLSGKNVTHRRFYPTCDLMECVDNEDYNRVISEAGDILRNNMILISRKWEKPWISLTGGIDSNTTFAAANGIYDKYQSFSYCSAKKETIDCAAARKIAATFDMPWRLFEIPSTSEELADYDGKVAVIRHNNGYIALEKPNELRKRVYLEENLQIGVEVKSWVSETIRAYWYKHFNRKSMPKISGKLFRNLYKIFIADRSLAREVDSIFEKYIDEFEYRRLPVRYLPADMHFNEVTWGSWGSLNISEMKFYSDITIAYNNRRFLDLMFRVPLEKRISDQHHLDMKKYLNKKLYDMGIRVVNMTETRFRAFCLNLIFEFNSLLPF